MILIKCTFLVGLILTLLLDPILGRKGFGGSHSYPKSGGLSGGGHRSGGLSGGGHVYPSNGHSGGLSGGGSSYPNSGKSHGYPSSGSGSSLSGGGRGYPSNTNVKQTTNVHHHYHYSPPSQISYAPRGGGPPVSYPVYHGTPPTYVYQYKDSGSKYGTLLAGLALMNLGTLGVASYAAHKASQNQGSSYTYKSQPGEVCKFAVKSPNGDYEETRIDCQIISSFIYQDMEAKKTGNSPTVTTTTTVTNVTVVNSTNAGANQSAPQAPGNVLYTMLPNGTLVPVNATVVQPQAPPSPADSSSSVVVTTTTTNTTLVNALDVKGKPLEVTSEMQCFVIRLSPMGDMKKSVPCRLIQTYAERSLKPNTAAKHVPMLTFVAAIVAYCVAY